MSLPSSTHKNTSRSTSASSSHLKDLEVLTDSRITSDSTPVTGSALIAPAMTDSSSQTATKASSQQSTHHQPSSSNNYPLRSADAHAKKPLTSGNFNPHDFKGASLVSSAQSGHYNNNNNKMPNRGSFYGGNGTRGGRGGGNNSYRGNYRPSPGRFNPNPNAGVNANPLVPYNQGRPQGENAVTSYSIPSPQPSPQPFAHYAAEAQAAMPSVIPSMVPAWTPYIPCPCPGCNPSATPAGCYVPNIAPYPFGYYASCIQQQMQPNAPMAAQPCYPGYVADGQLMYQLQSAHFQPPSQDQHVSYASALVRATPLMNQKVTFAPAMPVPPYARVNLDTRANGLRYTNDSNQWISQGSNGEPLVNCERPRQ